MRNILITVMMLIVAALLFNKVIADDTSGVKRKIEDQGDIAVQTIGELNNRQGLGQGS